MHFNLIFGTTDSRAKSMAQTESSRFTAMLLSTFKYIFYYYQYINLLFKCPFESVRLTNCVLTLAHVSISSVSFSLLEGIKSCILLMLTWSLFLSMKFCMRLCSSSLDTFICTRFLSMVFSITGVFGRSCDTLPGILGEF